MKSVIMVTLTIVVIITLIAVMEAQLSQTMGLQENVPESTAGNITEPEAPQGTSLAVTNDTSTVNIPEATAGNITEPIAPG